MQNAYEETNKLDGRRYVQLEFVRFQNLLFSEVDPSDVHVRSIVLQIL